MAAGLHHSHQEWQVCSCLTAFAQLKGFGPAMIKVWQRIDIGVPGRWHPFTQLERRAREATRNEAW